MPAPGERRSRRVADDADLLLLAGDLTQTGTRGRGPRPGRARSRASRIRSSPCSATTTYDAVEVSDARRDPRCARQSACSRAATCDPASRRPARRYRRGRRASAAASRTALRQRLRRARDEGLHAGHAHAWRSGSARRSRALDADVRIALLHYAPIPETLEGEPPELYPFLGSDLLGHAIDDGGRRSGRCTATPTSVSEYGMHAAAAFPCATWRSR